MLAGTWLVFIFLAAICVPCNAPKDTLAQDLLLGRLPPFWVNGAEPGYCLGTDSLGCDVLSRILYGTRLALTVALVAGSITCVVDTTLGLMAGHLRGWVVVVISRLVDIWMAFPPALFSIILAIVVIDWTRFARVVRAEAMAQGAMEYVAPTQVAGRVQIGIMLREILPKVLPTFVVLLALEMGIAVIVEAILSFVNLSISTDDPTWGGMIAEGRTSVYQTWWAMVFPLITMFLTALSFSQLGEGLKDRFDPVLRRAFYVSATCQSGSRVRSRGCFGLCRWM